LKRPVKTAFFEDPDLTIPQKMLNMG